MSRLLDIVIFCACVGAYASLGTGCRFDKTGRDETGDGAVDVEVSPSCGDGVLDDGDGEECDGGDLGGQTCEGLGYTGGTLACTATCTLDETLCDRPLDCGNNVIDLGEECDGADLGGATCATATSYTEGLLACQGSCLLDTSGCHTCGDGSIDGPEHCDGASLGGQDCAGLGHLWGDLVCAADCRFDESGCHDYPANWYDLTCPYRKTITIDPAWVDAPLTSFPVLVKLIDADLRDLALPTAGDIRFADEPGGLQLDHEVESYDPTTGTLVAWVGLDTISDTLPTVFYMYYGDAACGASVDPTGVWDGSYRGVWHLSELGTSLRLDSAANALHASTAGYEGDEGGPGWLDGADHLDGTDDHLLLPAAATVDLEDFTICFWIRTTESRSDVTGWQNPTLTGNISNGFESGDFGILTEAGMIGLRSGLCAGSDERHMSTIAINDDLWHHVCAVAEGQTISLWVDGAFGAQVCAGGRAIKPPAFWVGGHSGEATASRGDYHQGVYDELRISAVARSPAWRNACHANQLAPNAFYTPGPQESLP